jgi:hypothetical protein
MVEMVSVEVPAPVTCAGANEQEDLLGSPEQANVTVPLKLPGAWMFIVYDADVPALTVALAGVPLSVKSAMFSVTAVE